MSDPMQVFDRPLLRRRRDRAAATQDAVLPVLEQVADLLLDRLDDTTRRFTRALDLGGRGVVAPALRARGIPFVVSADLSPRMAARAGGLAVGADEEWLPFAEGAFDLVFCEGDPVSYCLDEYPRAIRELLRVAAPGAPVVMGVDSRYEYFTGTLKHRNPADALAVLLTGKTTCPYGLPVHAFTLRELNEAVRAAGGEVDEIFGKPVLFWELLQSLKAARGDTFDPWEAREEILAHQERMAHEGFGATGFHLQVMARRKA